MTSPSLFYDEIMGQPAALQRLLDEYAAPEGRRVLAAVPPASRPVLLGMGASYHSALLAARHMNSLGFAAQALEATDVLYGGDGPLAAAGPLVYISQSGSSGEIAPLLAGLPPNQPLVALTNDERSPLAHHAQVVLPLLAGDEQLVATKTYLNSIALLWLLAHQWAGALGADAFDAVGRVRQRLAALLAEGPALVGRWAEVMAPAQAFVCIGSGQQAPTARQAAMMTMEWLKLPALSSTVGAFRHGPLEIAQPGLGVVVFVAPGPAYESSCRLAQTLQGYGASVLLIENGRVRGPGEPAAADGLPPAEHLSPLVDIVPAQLLVEALARQRGVAPGFRHIDKVTTLL
jgi:glutamine---fructose-6-phosphate transaminase (isomerizing)